MESKPLHYDGSFQNMDTLESEATTNEEFVLTEEIRKNISGNPYLKNEVK